MPRPTPSLRRCVALSVLTGLLLAAPTAAAAVAPPAKAKIAAKSKPKKKKPRGIVPYLRVDLNFSFAQTQGVVGVPDGLALAMGLRLQGGLVYRKGLHSWITTLVVDEAQTKVPGLKPFVKGADVIDVTSVYRTRFKRVSWLGLFGGIRLSGTLMAGTLLRAEDTRLELHSANGTTFRDVARAQHPYPLTEFLSPVVFRQGLGLLAQPLRRTAIRLSVQLGLTAWEIWGQDGYVVADDKDTDDVLELQQLVDSVQGGVNAELRLSGALWKKLLGYAVHADVMLPFARTPARGGRFTDRINLEFGVSLRLRLWRWVTLNYALSARRFPLISPDWQVQNQLLLSVTADIGKVQGAK